MKQLKPVILLDKYFAGIEKEIIKILREAIFEPLIKSIPAIELKNSDNLLFDKMEKGYLWFSEGYIYGEFNAQITKALIAIGAVYDKRKAGFKIATLPHELSSAMASYQDRVSKQRHALISAIDGIDINQALKDNKTLQSQYQQTFDFIDDKIADSVKSIGIIPKITEQMKERIAEEWSENLKIYIRSWGDKEILDLRNRITTNSLYGQRAEAMVADIERLYDVTKNKAKFLARQETALFMSKLRETRYAEMGVTMYRWSTSNDERVRDTHKKLNGKIFSFASPPIVDGKGHRANAGEDFGCRCLAIPVIENL